MQTKKQHATICNLSKIVLASWKKLWVAVVEAHHLHLVKIVHKSLNAKFYSSRSASGTKPRKPGSRDSLPSNGVFLLLQQENWHTALKSQIFRNLYFWIALGMRASTKKHDWIVKATHLSLWHHIMFQSSAFYQCLVKFSQTGTAHYRNNQTMKKIVPFRTGGRKCLVISIWSRAWLKGM